MTQMHLKLASFLIYFCLFSMDGLESAVDVPEPSFGLNITQELGMHDVDALDDGFSNLDKLITEFQGPELENFAQEIEESSWFHEQQVSNDKDEFIPLDLDLVKEAEGGGRDASAKLTIWARRRFDSWRVAFNHDCSIPLEDVPPKELAVMLMKFILQVKKKNGQVYPPGSLSVLYRTFGRILRKKQEKRVCESGIEEPPFNILKADVFKKSTYAFVIAVRRSRLLGAAGKKKKAPTIPFGVEQDILADVDHQVFHPRGVQKRLCFYICSRFGIRACKELWDLKVYQFSLGTSEHGEFVKYDEAMSKNNQPSVRRFEDHHFRAPVWSCEEDFVFTYKQYSRHLPARQFNDADKTDGALFLTPIDSWTTNVWYHKQRVGTNTITKWLKVMGDTVNADICNKSGRVTLVSRLSLAGVPAEVGMKITGHKTFDAFKQYDRSTEVQVDAAMAILAQPVNDDGTCRVYSSVLNDQMDKKRKAELGVMENRKQHCLRPTTQQFADSGLVLNASTSVSGIAANEQANTISTGHFMPMTVGGADKENIAPLAEEYLDFIDNDVVDKLMASDPIARRALIGGNFNVTKGNSLTNTGGQSFMGATFSGCVFLSCGNPTEAANVLGQLNLNKNSET